MMNLLDKLLPVLRFSSYVEIVGGDTVSVSSVSSHSSQLKSLQEEISSLIPHSCEPQKYIYLFTKLGYVRRKFKF